MNININELNTRLYCNGVSKAWCSGQRNPTLEDGGKWYAIALSSIVVSLVEAVARTIFTVCYLPFAICDAVMGDQDGNKFFINNLKLLGIATVWAVASPILVPMLPLIVVGYGLCCSDDQTTSAQGQTAKV